MAQKNRYLINYKEVNGTWEKVFAKGIKEANELYDMIGNEAESKVLIDLVTGKQIRQTQPI
jgi:hypothetical protein